jgi:mRNA interferase HigB
VRIIALSTLRTFWERHKDAEGPLKAWYQEARAAHWDTPHQVKALYRTASVLGNNRVVFNIAGNNYRLIVKINYPYRIVFIRFVGTHAEYDRINAEEI